MCIPNVHKLGHYGLPVVFLFGSGKTLCLDGNYIICSAGASRKGYKGSIGGRISLGSPSMKLSKASSSLSSRTEINLECFRYVPETNPSIHNHLGRLDIPKTVTDLAYDFTAESRGFHVIHVGIYTGSSGRISHQSYTFNSVSSIEWWYSRIIRHN